MAQANAEPTPAAKKVQALQAKGFWDLEEPIYETRAAFRIVAQLMEDFLDPLRKVEGELVHVVSPDEAEMLNHALRHALQSINSLEAKWLAQHNKAAEASYADLPPRYRPLVRDVEAEQ